MLKTLESCLTRFADVPARDRVRAYLYRAELVVRTQSEELAQASLTAAKAVQLTDAEKASVAEELAHVQALTDQDQQNHH